MNLDEPSPAQVAQWIKVARSMNTSELLRFARLRYTVDFDPPPNWVRVVIDAMLRERRSVWMLSEGVGEPWV